VCSNWTTGSGSFVAGSFVVPTLGLNEVLAVVAVGVGVSHEGVGMVLLVNDGLFVNSSSSIALLNGGVVAGFTGGVVVTV